MVLLFNGRINALTWFARFSQFILMSNSKASFQHNLCALTNVNVNVNTIVSWSTVYVIKTTKANRNIKFVMEKSQRQIKQFFIHFLIPISHSHFAVVGLAYFLCRNFCMKWITFCDSVGCGFWTVDDCWELKRMFTLKRPHKQHEIIPKGTY